MKSYHDVAGPAGSYNAFLFDADGRSETYLAREFYCEEPSCDGNESQIFLHRRSDPGRFFSFHLNFATGEVIGDADLSGTDGAIAVEFATDAKIWHMLERHRQLVRAWGLAHWDEEPPVPAEDRCYRFADFDMQGELHALRFERDGTSWLVCDQYCANPACDCRDALLSFLTLEAGAKRPSERFGVSLDLKTGRARRLANGATLSKDELDVLTTFQRELENWQSELGLRRSLLRKIAARRLRTTVAPREVARARTGRNDPCPCGSGRKYKKCCGAA